MHLRAGVWLSAGLVRTKNWKVSENLPSSFLSGV
jgi:hypothetical protein